MVRHTLKSLGPKVLADPDGPRLRRAALHARRPRRSRALNGDYAGAQRAGDWKHRVRAGWPAVRVDHVESSGVGDAPGARRRRSTCARSCPSATSRPTTSTCRWCTAGSHERRPGRHRPSQSLALAETYEGGRHRFEGRLDAGDVPARSATRCGCCPSTRTSPVAGRARASSRWRRSRWRRARPRSTPARSPAAAPATAGSITSLPPACASVPTGWSGSVESTTSPCWTHSFSGSVTSQSTGEPLSHSRNDASCCCSPRGPGARSGSPETNIPITCRRVVVPVVAGHLAARRGGSRPGPSGRRSIVGRPSNQCRCRSAGCSRRSRSAVLRDRRRCRARRRRGASPPTRSRCPGVGVVVAALGAARARRRR